MLFPSEENRSLSPTTYAVRGGARGNSIDLLQSREAASSAVTQVRSCPTFTRSLPRSGRDHPRSDTLLAPPHDHLRSPSPLRRTRRGPLCQSRSAASLPPLVGHSSPHPSSKVGVRVVSPRRGHSSSGQQSPSSSAKVAYRHAKSHLSRVPSSSPPQEHDLERGEIEHRLIVPSVSRDVSSRSLPSGPCSSQEVFSRPKWVDLPPPSRYSSQRCLGREEGSGEGIDYYYPLPWPHYPVVHDRGSSDPQSGPWGSGDPMWPPPGLSTRGETSTSMSHPPFYPPQRPSHTAPGPVSVQAGITDRDPSFSVEEGLQDLESYSVRPQLVKSPEVSSPPPASTQEQEGLENWTFDQAIREIYRLLPTEICPPPPSLEDDSILGCFEEMAGRTLPQALLLLPHSPTIQKLERRIVKDQDTARTQPNWSVPLAVFRALSSSGSYKVHSPYWPQTPPPMDANAGLLGISTGQPALSSSQLLALESKARQLVTVASHADLITAATFNLLKEEVMSTGALLRLLEAIAKTSRHSLMIGLSLSSEFLHLRRDAALNTSRSLLDQSKGILRSAPLTSSTLFGGLISQVAEQEIRTKQLLQLTASGPSRSTKRPRASAPPGPPPKFPRQQFPALQPVAQRSVSFRPSQRGSKRSRRSKSQPPRSGRPPPRRP